MDPQNETQNETGTGIPIVDVANGSSTVPPDAIDNGDSVPPQHAYDAESAPNIDALQNSPRRSGCHSCGRTLFLFYMAQFGIGILSLPSAMKTLGIIPGVAAIISMGVLAWLGAYQLFRFYSCHPEAKSIVDMCHIVGGRWFAITAGCFMVMQLVLMASSAVVVMSIAFDTIFEHANCTKVYTLIPCLLCLAGSMCRFDRFSSTAGIIASISLLATLCIVVMAGVDSFDGALSRKLSLFGYPSFWEAINAYLLVLYAFTPTIPFVGVMAQMEDPRRDFVLCLNILEIGTTALYSSVAVLIYCLSGEYTQSPALEWESVFFSKLAYGVVLPAAWFIGLSYGYLGADYLLTTVVQRCRWFSGQTFHNGQRLHVLWMGCGAGFWLAAFGVSASVPTFNSIVSVASAFTACWFAFGLSAVFWLYLNWDFLFVCKKTTCFTALNIISISFCVFLNISGLWSSISYLTDL